ncbi:hypothetical protein CEXT_479331 [Caerostris extrusa]|uniref:Uncharacterized protein n=1 Tax=Caerostris extrusa TaxID=172846 RepID=A0AAV4PWJ5_CAEEX|nr:hypothetical protein CEXT_479331 [Caerostris extrusa]
MEAVRKWARSDPPVYSPATKLNAVSAERRRRNSIWHRAKRQLADVERSYFSITKSTTDSISLAYFILIHLHLQDKKPLQWGQITIHCRVLMANGQRRRGRENGEIRSTSLSANDSPFNAVSAQSGRNSIWHRAKSGRIQLAKQIEVFSRFGFDSNCGSLGHLRTSERQRGEKVICTKLAAVVHF